MGVTIAGHPLVVGAFLFVKCDEDIRHMKRIYESFEDLTKALINHKKSRLLGLGVSKERKQCPLKGLTSSPNIQVPGIVFCPTAEETVTMNLNQLQTKVRKSQFVVSFKLETDSSAKGTIPLFTFLFMLFSRLFIEPPCFAILYLFINT